MEPQQGERLGRVVVPPSLSSPLDFPPIMSISLPLPSPHMVTSHHSLAPYLTFRFSPSPSLHLPLKWSLSSLTSLPHVAPSPSLPLPRPHVAPFPSLPLNIMCTPPPPYLSSSCDCLPLPPSPRMWPPFSPAPSCGPIHQQYSRVSSAHQGIGGGGARTHSLTHVRTSSDADFSLLRPSQDVPSTAL